MQVTVKILLTFNKHFASKVFAPEVASQRVNNYESHIILMNVLIRRLQDQYLMIRIESF